MYNGMYIDVAAHIMTPKFAERYAELVPAIMNSTEMKKPVVSDLEIRMRLMSRYPKVLQVLTMANVPLERYVEKTGDAVELARIGNDDLAELVLRYPDKFVGAAAILPMNDVDESCKEAQRALNECGLQGIQVYTRINGVSVADKKYLPVFEIANNFGLPVWIHPTDNPQLDPDGDLFTWEFELASCMHKLVSAGIYRKFPKIKIIIHHAGTLAPLFSGRIKYIYKGSTMPEVEERWDDFRKFYVDTALYGNTYGLMDSYAFYGPERLLFGTDAPLGPKWGMIEGTIESIDRMDIPDEEKRMIFKSNALDMFNLVL